MPSAFGHALFALSLTPFRPYKAKLLPTILLSVSCAIIPDLDVLGFEYGIPYDSIFGHRGLSHSIVFAFILSIIITTLFFKEFRKDKIKFLNICWYYFLCTISHGLFDAMTTGGLGVGFFTPFLADRYFFSIRPIPVSPLNLQAFFTEYGWYILKAEFQFIGLISFFVLIGGYFWRKYILQQSS
ncbi:MAG: metal-dependent hydrolase [Saprospiraceae bacterium]|nr:metal-dependent hydrolase [Saprospiraceae bacterium]MBK8448954.1 metal-dependent hydrolase [Saprospiraceae bacterium]MBK9223199.1 metal-dependent hydrolase [Saprospiraceae bacterium]MBK9720729.1 metal-dependent hydrolase [Saprospiraceae bacterium]